MSPEPSGQLFSPFSIKPVPSESFWKKLFRRPAIECAKTEIENALVRNGPDKLWPAEISEIARRYRLGPSDIRGISTALFRGAVNTAVIDDTMSNVEATYIATLRSALQVSEDEAMTVEKAVIHPRFQRAVNEVLEDKRLSADEKQRLAALRTALRLDPWEYEILFGPTAKRILQGEIDAIIEDKRVSPDELARLGGAAANLGIDLTLGNATEQLVREYGSYWKIENGDIPIEDVQIVLQKGEVCHFTANVTWNELRTKTVTTDLGSIGYSFRIARGVYYRSPRIRATRVKQDQLTHIDTGVLYLTNKRIIFNGQSKNSTIKLSALLGFTPYADALELEKATGRSPVLGFSPVERAAVILGAVLARA